MAKERVDQDPVMTAYVVHLIRRWQAEKRELKELARLGGMARSVPSQVLKGTMGVGGKTREGFARALGFASVDDLRAAAQAHWAATHQVRALNAAQQEALDTLVALGQGTDVQIRDIMAAYSMDRFGDRGKDWWLTTVAQELAHDRTGLREESIDRKRDLGVKRKVRKEKRNLAEVKDRAVAARAAKAAEDLKNSAPRTKRTG